MPSSQQWCHSTSARALAAGKKKLNKPNNETSTRLHSLLAIKTYFE